MSPPTTQWPEITARAAEVLRDRIRIDTIHGQGLRSFQRDIVEHVLGQLAARPGMIVAERTGRGKSQIAMALMASLAVAKASTSKEPLRVALLAPNQAVLGNWMNDDGLVERAFSAHHVHPTYLWTDPASAISYTARSAGRSTHNDQAPALEIFADHYTRGLTNSFGEWGKTARSQQAHAKEFLGHAFDRVDLLVIDEAHQLRSSHNTRARAIETLFGRAEAPISVDRVLLLTATPFQLRAAQELVRLTQILRYPSKSGGTDFESEFLARLSLAAVQRRFDDYQRALGHWLRECLAARPADDALNRAEEQSHALEALLRPLIVRADDPRGDWLETRFGHPNLEHGSKVPDPSSGLELDVPIERLLFLAWDGSIASRTTFIATEQQTLTSSAEALRARQERIRPSAAERARTPLAPSKVQEALAKLSESLSKQVKPDHVKVRATANAVAARLRASPYRPVLVFVERTATLGQLASAIDEQLAGVAQVRTVHGGTHWKAREDNIDGFQSGEVHALLVSRVAEMGLDIDGPAGSEDICLLHHDFPWNPAMVEQRNGRVARPATGRCKQVYVFYPFVRDTVDERIFKRMLMRQALAEVFLGTNDVTRALRIADHDTLDGLDPKRIDATLLRRVTPDLSPPANDATPSPPPVLESITPAGRPSWCPLELIDLVAKDSEADPELDCRVEAIAADFTRWFEDRVHYVQVDLDDGRRQVVAISRRAERIEALSLADNRLPPERACDALRHNSGPGIAGLTVRSLAGGAGAGALVARAANLAATMSDSELRRLLLDTAGRADQWEREMYAEDDRW